MRNIYKRYGSKAISIIMLAIMICSLIFVNNVSANDSADVVDSNKETNTIFDDSSATSYEQKETSSAISDTIKEKSIKADELKEIEAISQAAADKDKEDSKFNSEGESSSDSLGEESGIAYTPSLLGVNTTDPTAILYSNGDFVFQIGDALDTSKGKVVVSYTNFTKAEYTNAASVPWKDVKDDIKKVIIKDSISPINTSYWFYKCTNLVSVEGAKNLKMDNNTSLRDMFASCTSLEEVDLTGWNTSKVTTMYELFDSCSNLQKVNLTGWNTSKVTNFNYMFYKSGVVKVDISHFNFGSISAATGMFYCCYSLKEVKMPTRITGNNLKSLDTLFYECDKLREVDLSWVATSGVNYSNAFSKTKLNKLICSKMQMDFTRAQLEDSRWKQSSTGAIMTTNELIEQEKKFGKTKSETYYRIKDVDFYSDYPANKETITVVYGDKYKDSDAKVPTKDGYNFVGWYDSLSGGSKLINGQSLYEENDYYARWEPKKYKLTLDSNMGTSSRKIVDLNYDETYILRDNFFVRSGYSLSSWNTRSDGKGKSYPANTSIRELSTSEITLYAIWTKNEKYITVTFDPKNGQDIIIKKVEPGLKLIDIEPANMVKDGARFAYWADDKGEKVEDSTIISANKTLYAVYNADIKVTYHTNINNEVGTFTIKYDTSPWGYLSTFNFKNGDNGYRKFLGWYEVDVNQSLYGKYVISSSTRFTKDKDVYAHWYYQPTLNPNGGEIIEKVDFPKQTASKYKLDKLPTAKKNGYVFEGWYQIGKVNKLVKVGETIDLSNGYILQAKWREDKVTLKLDYTAPSGAGTVTYRGTTETIFTRGQVIDGLLAPKASRNYDFVAWKDANGKVYKNGDIISTDLTLFAEWRPKEDVTIIFDPMPGTTDTLRKTVSKGSPIGALPTPRLSGYIFEGWFTQPNGQGEKVIEDKVINAAGTFYAKYKKVTETYKDSATTINMVAEWVNASNDQVYNENDYLKFNFTSASTATAQLHLRLDISNVQSAIPVGMAKIHVPKSVWKNWENNITGSNDVSLSLPKWPNTRSDQLFSYQETEDEYIFINNTELSSGAGLDIVVAYSTPCMDVPGGAVSDLDGRLSNYESYKNKFPVRFEVDINKDSKNEIVYEKNLSVEMNTSLDLIQNINQKAYFCSSWGPEWGDAPQDAEDYFYVKWTVRPDVENVAQPYRFYISQGGNTDVAYISYNINNKQYMQKETVDFNGSSYVVRYPKSLLKDIPLNGITVKAQVKSTVIWESGYEESVISDLSYHITNPKYPTGNFAKYNLNTNGIKYKLDDAQNVILDDEKEVGLAFRLNFSGSAHKEEPIWDEQNNTYKVNTSVIEMTDGEPGSLLYNSGLFNNRYNWEPDGGNIALTENDYRMTGVYIVDNKDIDGIKVGDNWFETSTNSYGEKLIDVYIRYAFSNEYIYYKSLQSGQSISLPNNVVGVKFRRETNKFSNDIKAQIKYALKPTENVKSLLNADKSSGVTSIIKNVATCDLYSADDPNKDKYFHVKNNDNKKLSAELVIYELGAVGHKQEVHKKTTSIDAVKFDNTKGTQDNIVVLWAQNKNLPSTQRKAVINSGVFYDLLPPGTMVDEKSVCLEKNVASYDVNSYRIREEDYNYALAKNGGNINDYSVEFRGNWEGSGRTMMIIRFSFPESSDYSGLKFYYKLTNTYDNIIARGTSVQNDVAFVDMSRGVSKPDTITGTNPAPSAKDYFKSISDDCGGQLGYASVAVPYKAISAYSWGFNKYVKARSGIYSSEEETMPGDLYNYKLSYIQSREKTSGKLMFVDLLEAGLEKVVNNQVTPRNSAWVGTFDSVNISALESAVSAVTGKKCKPVVYYSTTDRSVLKNSAFYKSIIATSETKAPNKIAADSNWTTKMPADKSKITAIAIDCSKSEDGSDFIVGSEQVMFAEMTLKAPDNKEAYNKMAYNEGLAVVDMSEKGTEYKLLKSDTSITLKDTIPELHKESDPASGTETDPKLVRPESDIVYKLTITNVDKELTLKNIVLQDNVPKEVTVDTDNIKVSFNKESDAIKVSDSARVTQDKDASNPNNLLFNIISLKPGEKVTFLVPTTVNIQRGKIINTSRIIKINGNDRDIKSETTYHEVKPLRDIVVKKNVTGELGEKNKYFNFKMKLEGADVVKKIEYTITKASGQTKGYKTLDNSGICNFELKDGESIKFIDIPVGSNYEVTELDGESQGYRVTVVNGKGVLQEYKPALNPAGSTDESLYITFDNHKDKPVALPYTWSFEGLYILLAIVAVGTFGTLLKVNRRKIK